MVEKLNSNYEVYYIYHVSTDGCMNHDMYRGQVLHEKGQVFLDHYDSGMWFELGEHLEFHKEKDKRKPKHR